jgi:hypothetical protein
MGSCNHFKTKLGQVKCGEGFELKQEKKQSRTQIQREAEMKSA